MQRSIQLHNRTWTDVCVWNRKPTPPQQQQQQQQAHNTATNINLSSKE
jgi:hypothetical protein